MIAGAIFDLDGTLLDTMGMWSQVITDYLHTQGKAPKAGLLDDISAMSLLQAAAYCRKEYSLPYTDEEIVDAVLQRVRHFYLCEAKPMPNVKPFLAQLSSLGVRMCVATASDHTLIAHALKRCDMAHYFSQILDCIEAGHGKDAPDIYRQSLAHLGTPKEKTIVFEDATHAIETAKADGFLVASVYSPFEKDAERVRTLSDVHIDAYDNTEAFWQFAESL